MVEIRGGSQSQDYHKTYVGERLLGYTCTKCSKFYKMWSNYLKHKCEAPEFKCPLCPFAAFKAFILTAHRAEHHPDAGNT
ncbi:hypothetical protein TSAR_011818 [Trichomalopsis sarcophagae]|uniref:C2H2-type domain-containing protein n=1 Tax=Trichomalopsis sarcophagae TaxID=543379 RepID=A0A232F611_9HYME|nr:hypothetical protein TSAR_011818 [Trichomalopsis sarcophagae]